MMQHQAGAIKTVMGKARFKQWLWDQCVSEVKYYHGDNGIFSAEEYRRDCEEKGQSQSFSGVGAQHQNARAERAIQTIMNMAQTFCGIAFSMDLQSCSECWVRTYSFGISYNGMV